MLRSTTPASLFGIRLRAAREHANLPQDRLGADIGIDESCASARISRYETGVHQPPYALAQKLATALKVPTAYLYCDDNDLAALILKWGTFGPRKRQRLLEAMKSLAD
ncbi:MAG: helix-turn-helix transcriptional regulator [Proteobacteria bacterium]|nr:helix-turn-helix transcriptional regulator [Pseudomonadota bacterium]